MNRLLIFLGFWLSSSLCYGQQQLVAEGGTDVFSLEGVVIVVDTADLALVQRAAMLLQQDIELVTGKKPKVLPALSSPGVPAIFIGAADKSETISNLARKNGLRPDSLKGKWERYILKTTSNQVFIIGSDRRGTAYGVFEFSRQLGVSPWYWWADVPVKKKTTILIKRHQHASDEPKVKYRGIFINDEAPALSGWAKEKFGGFNHLFYEKVFELILRLKGNYIWPAMWGNAFYDDDSLNIHKADEYGIVIGTSHHEPLMRAHDEWRRYGSGKWNYDSNAVRLQEFWRKGLARSTNEKIVTVGMRGDGDEPMSRETATGLLEKIVADQRTIIKAVTGKPASETPQLWALYKEVQDYYDKGMRVPDDVTLLLCDDNWGNIRKLPKPGEQTRKGGYGIYYHFDYVGGPRNYKWINTNAIPRVWEQMHLAWEHNVKDIWIVNVGDIKPVEYPISFFLDYAWNPEKIGRNDLQQYADNWAESQFGKKYGAAIGKMLSTYSKFNARRKPEMLDATTYSLATGEWDSVVVQYNRLLKEAETIAAALPAQHYDAFFQLVLHPVKASANLNEMYLNVARNREAASNKWIEANEYAEKARRCYEKDSLITIEYHQLNNGKWNKMMSQTHIGYRSWQEPRRQQIPELKFVAKEEAVKKPMMGVKDVQVAVVPKGTKGYVFYEEEGKGVSINADHFTMSRSVKETGWQVLPDHGRTGSAIAVFPVTAGRWEGKGEAPFVEYEVYTYSAGPCAIHAYFSPTLNFYNTPDGLQYAVSVDGGTPEVLSLNKEDRATGSGIWNRWAGENIIIKTSNHNIPVAGRHKVRITMVDAGVVLQKLVLDFGNVAKTYLGPPETLFNPKNN
ncbi:MAG: glycosyl hydrolase 115 family protein [Chitinophagaceae bacterium]